MKKIIYIAIMSAVFMACDDRLMELNTPSKLATEVPVSTLFLNGMVNTFGNMESSSVNNNPFRLYAQYVAQCTYPEESQYNLTREIPYYFWRGAYRDALSDLNTAKSILTAELEVADAAFKPKLNNQLACTQIMMDYTYSVLVDAFGDVPYTEALDPDNISPSYDDAATIYDNVLASLDESISRIDVGEVGFESVQDPVYGGDMNGWKAFANTLKLRMGMRLADVNASKSISVVNSALASGVISSNNENVSITYGSSSPNNNPLYSSLVLSGRQDFVGANTIVDIMNTNNDPRRYVFFAENLGSDTFLGGVYGDANAYATNSHLGDLFHTADLPGTLIGYAEVEFLMAEMVERGGYSVSGTAVSHYNAGIQASFDQWGIGGAAAYMAQPSVTYATATGTWQQKIGTQLWLALYNQGFEGWTTWRRLDMNIFNAPPILTLSDIPVRLPYPLREGNQNGTNYDAAGSKIGGDLVSTKIFWDKF